MTIDLRSDTVTQPTEQMREAILHAEVGDDVYGEDPTINELQEQAAAQLGKEAGLFVTSGTQGNLLAVLSQTERGDEVILGEDSHLFYSETGSLAAIAGVQTRTLESVNGQMTIERIAKSIRTTTDLHQPKTGLVCLENTHARSGGSILPLSYMEKVADLAGGMNIPIHLDGSRLFNASVRLGVDVQDITQYAGTVLICLSKGLSAPMGSILVGDQPTINRARRWRKALGGGTRQAGIVGAAGQVALASMVDRLAIDHTNAEVLADGLHRLPELRIINEEVHSNIVIVSLEQLPIDATLFIQRLKDQGILVSRMNERQVRLVTHREISRADVERVVRVIKEMVQEV
ncbi:low-specificity L-threonine aldolase [Geomicrobium sp. JCM 19039]|uniref:low-specificity L-threonine aldolase n=1 Tax=Geomicrobium sp. JCM 19039 TaxID=1460636 RepID=UPI00045F12F8|nr:low-specificity L-threonine aldolase [Geomicrobium sp. JCM 19039]GAK12369.1 low-specificity L-threonine aldolase [Geomicrobium sp. JCM 19039]